MIADVLKSRPKLLFLVFLLAGIGRPAVVDAQKNAPEFLCVQNDTLRWDQPASLCGDFNAYLIYSSADYSGPYSLLTTITDPARLSFFHDQASNQTWYYYMESDLDCPGQTVLKSDTLSNRIPDPGPIAVATVAGATTVRVDWSASPSPQVIGYIVSRQNELGTTILDTVYNALTYTDAFANPGLRAETYFVVALDPCGNVSLVPDPHRTIFLEVISVDSCSQEINLSWTDYITWPNGVEQYEILVSEVDPVGGTPGPYLPAGTVGGDVTEFTYPALNDGRTYCFKIQAVAAGSGELSLSNEACAAVGVVQAVRDLVITDLTVTPEAVTIGWILQPDISLASATLLRSENGTDFSPLADLNAGDGSYTDITPLGNSQPLTYRIEAVDLCGNAIVSNAAATIFLSGASEGDENQLNWTPYLNEAGRLLSYELYRIVGGSETFEATYGQNELMHTDPIDLADPTQALVCYYIVANGEVILSDGAVNVSSVSNVMCLEQSAELYVPNAFVPDGVNRIFKPVLQFGNPQEYLMAIYDRYGGLIFESKDISMGWDGRKDGRPLPQGMYLYLIRMKQGPDRLVEKKGMVLLLR